MHFISSKTNKQKKKLWNITVNTDSDCNNSVIHICKAVLKNKNHPHMLLYNDLNVFLTYII